MNFFRNARLLRVLRPIITVLALFASVWHAMHMLSAWRQSQQYRDTEPALADYFWRAFQSELAVTIVALFAAAFAWHLFRPRQQPPA